MTGDRSRLSFYNLRAGLTVKIRLPTGLWSLLSLACWFLLWYVITALDLVDTDFLTPPVKIAEEFWRLLSEPYAGSSLYVHFGASLSRALLGFFLAIVLAVPLGLLMGMNRIIFTIFNPLFSLLRPIPTIAFIPLMILWFGIGETSKILIILVSAFLFIVLNTYQGVLQIPMGYRRVAENLGTKPWQLFWWVILPASAPSIMTGVKTGLAISWAVVVAAELIAAQQGLGYMIMDAATFFRIPIVYIGVLLIGIVGFLLEGAVTLTESKVIHWRGR